jgi:hypothetical protein
MYARGSNASEIKIEGEKESDLRSIANFLNQKFLEPPPSLTPEQLNTCANDVPQCESVFTLSEMTTAWEIRLAYINNVKRASSMRAADVQRKSNSPTQGVHHWPPRGSETQDPSRRSFVRFN